MLRWFVGFQFGVVFQKSLVGSAVGRLVCCVVVPLCGVLHILQYFAEFCGFFCFRHSFHWIGVVAFAVVSKCPETVVIPS